MHLRFYILFTSDCNSKMACVMHINHYIEKYDSLNHYRYYDM